MEGMMMAYFNQGREYFSESGRVMRPVSAMHPTHAANAADRLLRDASFWADEAGMVTRYPRLWMTTRPLFRALLAQSGNI